MVSYPVTQSLSQPLYIYVGNGGVPKEVGFHDRTALKTRVYAFPYGKLGALWYGKFPGLPTHKILWEPEQLFKLIETADKMDYSSLGTMPG